MLTRTLRTLPRRAALPAPALRTHAPRRTLIISPPPGKKASWKGTFVRWAAAGGVVYYYNTSPLFAEGTSAEAIDRLDQSIHHIQDSSLPTTLEAIQAERKARREEVARVEAEKQREMDGESELLAGEERAVREDEASVEGLEEEADQQGAFNPETGEINWDCPCLGGMAHGPCGEEFRAAFSCFVYSKEEPKGVECIEKFKGMQDCFRAHPEMYASELEEDEVEEEIQDQIDSKAPLPETESPAEDGLVEESRTPTPTAPKQESGSSSDATSETPDGSRNGDEGGELIPRDLHEGMSGNAK